MEDERLSGVVLHISDSQTSYPGEHQIRVTLRIGTFIPGHPFVTSPMIRRAIQKIKLAGGRPIGRMEFFIDHQKKIITSHEIRPTSLLHGKANSSFQKIGLSTRVELAIEKIFKRQFPDYSLRSTANPSAVRTTQLQKRGRTIGKPTLSQSPTR